MTLETNFSEDARRSEALREIIIDLIEKRTAGETVTDESLIERHPDLMPELADELRKLRLVECAEQDARSLQEGFHIRCPHCRNPVEIVDDESLSDLRCSSCGSRFSLVDDTDRTFQASSQQIIGHFQLLDKVGIGAFGSVWSARDTELDRQVAVKIPRKGQLSVEDGELFIREARAAAQLKHPHIVSVLEVGRHEDRIYIVTEFVQGLDLADWLTDERATPLEAADLCTIIADALQHAHDQGVIHRDLKPSNIMLDTAGEPHLMDFGLAKRESGEITMTIEGKLLGTPAYMSPEQARGAAHDADARSDVYSLGVILFELLTGERPFRGSTRMLLHQVLVADAPSPRKLNGQIPKDLETICLKCLEKAPANRYQTAGELREDLKRFLCGEPVAARPITKVARVWRWCSRKPVVAGLAVTVVSLLLFVAISAPIVAARQSILARRAIDSGEALQLKIYQSDVNSAYTAWINHNLTESRRLLEQHQPDAGEKDHREFGWHYLRGLHQKIDDQPKLTNECGVRLIFFSPDGSTLFAKCNDGVIRIWNVAQRSLLHELEHQGVTSMALSPDGQHLASCGWNKQVVLWRVSDGACLETLFEHPRPFLSVDFSADGKSLVCAGWGGFIGILDIGTRDWIEFPAQDEEIVMSARFSPNGEKLVSFSENEVLRIWDVGTRRVEQTRVMSRGGAKTIVFADEGQSIAVCGSKQVNVLDFSNGQIQKTIECPLADPNSLAISPSGKILAAPCDDSRVRLWNFETGELLDTLIGHADQTASIDFSPDGTLLATGSRNGVIRLWNEFSESRQERLATTSSQTRQTVVAVRDDHTLATGLGEFTGESPGDIKLWDLDRNQLRKAELHGGEYASVIALAFSPVSPVIASGGGHRHQRGEVKLWNIESGTQLKVLSDHKDFVLTVAFSPNGQLLATGCGGGEDRKVRVYDVATGQLQHEFEPIRRATGRTFGIASVEFSPDGTILAAGGGRWGWNQGEMRLWNVKSGEEIGNFPVEGGEVTDLTFYADGKKLAVATDRGVITLRDISEGSSESLMSGFSAPSIAVSPDGKTLVVGSVRKDVQLWHTETLGQLGVLRVPHSVKSLTFTPDGQTLIAGCGNATAWLWTPPSDETDVSKVVVLDAASGKPIDDR